MMMNCKTHGEVEGVKTLNNRVYCSLCWTEGMKEVMANVIPFTEPPPDHQPDRDVCQEGAEWGAMPTHRRMGRGSVHRRLLP